MGPSWQLVADDIRARIASGEYRVGEPVPSTTRLTAQHGVSSTVVRHAVEQLKNDGILTGHPGKAVYVRAMPEDAAAEQRDVKVLSSQVAELQGIVAELARRVDSLGDDPLRDLVTRVEVNLMELYGKLGHDYPGQREQRSNGRSVRHERTS
jgi:DNA-binding GntR family transcriptional regulator